MAADSMWQIKQEVYLHADSFYLALSVAQVVSLKTFTGILMGKYRLLISVGGFETLCFTG